MTKVLVMRTSDKDHRAHGGFQHPKKVGGIVEAPDWRENTECGGGIHGLLWGAGDGHLLDWSDSAVWQVYEVETDDGFVERLDGGGKCKFRRGVLIYAGDRHGATELIKSRAPGGTPVVAGTVTAGNRGTATAGNRGTATAGDHGTATAGDYGAATAGYRGTATAGYCGTATAGYCGTATAGYCGTATAGTWGVLMILRYDREREVYRYAIAMVDGETIKPNTAYRLDSDGCFVEAEKGGVA